MATASKSTIDRATLAFLSDLEKHNDRDWFNANKPRYLVAKEKAEAFADALIVRMKRHDRISTESGKESLMRIYNDQRFHKDKPPYKTNFMGSLGRVKPELRGGYFFKIQPGNSVIACGFFGPEPDDLKRIRADIDQDHGAWRKLLGSKAIKSHFGGLDGAQLGSAPRGYAKDHPALDLLRRKQFILRHAFTDKDVLAPGFVYQVDALFKSVRPWFDHMSEVLTTDVNGRSLLR
ncbi:MAG: DUF2461 domain-containing protein [Flavobacteriales bacterium]|nr:DUF2461 domain-containing protein [Flavobacteriales bacterium]